jgi:hypothetical protein
MIDGPFKPVIMPIIKDVKMEPIDWSGLDGLGAKVMSETVALIRKIYPDALARELADVDPEGTLATGKLVKALFDAARPEGELVAEGYEPVCPTTRLMWIKKADKVDQRDLFRADDDGFILRK